MPNWLKKVASFLWSIIKEKLTTQPAPSPVPPVPVPRPPIPRPEPIPVPVPEPLPPVPAPTPQEPPTAPIPAALASLAVDIAYRRWYGGEAWPGGQQQAAPTTNAGEGFGRATLTLQGRDSVGGLVDLTNAAPRARWVFDIFGSEGYGAVVLETINETEPHITQTGFVPFDVDVNQYKQSRGQSVSVRFHPDMPVGTIISGTVRYPAKALNVDWRMKPSILGIPIPDNKKVTCPKCGNRQPDEGSNQRCAKCGTKIPTLWR